MEYKEKVEHYFNKFEEAGLYKRAEFEDDEFASHLYFHYQNIVDDCAGLIEDPEDLMCWSCRKWYDYIVEATANKDYRDRMGGIEIIEIYDVLIQQSSNSIGKPINIGYRNWEPTEKAVETLINRRNKIAKGV